MVEARADGPGITCSCNLGILLAVIRSRGKRKSERIGWRCENCGAGYTNGFSRDHSLDKKAGRRRVIR